MSALQETDKALQDFLDKHDTCATCMFWTPELIGGICNAPEYPIGYLDHNTSTCEQHEFNNAELEEQLSILVDRHYNAWYIVEGFAYLTPRIEEL